MLNCLIGQLNLADWKLIGNACWRKVQAGMIPLCLCLTMSLKIPLQFFVHLICLSVGWYCFPK